MIIWPNQDIEIKSMLTAGAAHIFVSIWKQAYYSQLTYFVHLIL